MQVVSEQKVTMCDVEEYRRISSPQVNVDTACGESVQDRMWETRLDRAEPNGGMTQSRGRHTAAEFELTTLIPLGLVTSFMNAPRRHITNSLAFKLNFNSRIVFIHLFDIKIEICHHFKTFPSLWSTWKQVKDGQASQRSKRYRTWAKGAYLQVSA